MAQTKASPHQLYIISPSVFVCGAPLLPSRRLRTACFCSTVRSNEYISLSLKKPSPALSLSQSSVKAAFPRLAYLCHNLLRPSCKARDGKLAVSGLAELFQRRWAARSTYKRCRCAGVVPANGAGRVLPCWATSWAMFKSLMGYVSTGTAVGREGASAWTNTTSLGEVLAEMSPASISCALVPVPYHHCGGGFAIGTKAEPRRCPFSLAGYSWTPSRLPLCRRSLAAFLELIRDWSWSGSFV